MIATTFRTKRQLMKSVPIPAKRGMHPLFNVTHIVAATSLSYQ
jgi:hypothetical protein